MRTLSETIKVIGTFCETGQKSSSKARYSTCFKAPTMCYAFSNNVHILSIYNSYLMGITYEYFCIISLRGVRKNSLIPPLFSKCIYQGRKVTGHVYVRKWYRFFLFLPFFRLDFWIFPTVLYFLLMHVFSTCKYNANPRM